MSGKLKRVVFWLITLSFPVVLLALLEIGLRISGYNDDQQELFVEYAVNDDFLIVNPNFVTRYFPEFVPQIAPNPFRKVKTDSTFRIFVFGGSSAQGFPYNFYYSFAGQLEQKLLHQTKGVNVEVINLGMTAVNSFVIRDLSHRVLEYEPDAIIIYAGHNEYYGSFGVGSAQFDLGNNIRLKRLVLWFKNYLVYQFIEEVLSPEKQLPDVQRTLMARVVSESNIKQDSPLFDAGILQFEENIGSVLTRFSDHNIPVFLGTIASNLKDQPPLSSYWDAKNAFDLGSEFFAMGDIENAAFQFTQAKEYDAIRFRGPEAINETISKFADQDGVFKVETERALNELSVSGIADNSLFIDHLHPTDIGHGIMADLFLKELIKLEELSDIIEDNKFDVPLTLSDFEYSYSTAPIVRLLNGYPFVKGLTPEEELASFEVGYRDLLNKSFADSIGASTWRNDEVVAFSLLKILEELELKNDSLSYAKHYYELFNWLSFNDQILADGINFMSSNRKLDMYTVNVILKAVNSGFHDEHYKDVLNRIYQLHSEDTQLIIDSY